MASPARPVASPHLSRVSSLSSHSSSIAFGASKMLATMLLLFLSAPFAAALPVSQSMSFNAAHSGHGVDPLPADDPSLWVYMSTALVLVLLGGAFAGLTIALMGQDEIYLQVIATSGDGAERKNAQKVLNLLKRGKHWVLVTLLLSNVITNETLPIVLDRSLGGGWPAVLGSTILIGMHQLFSYCRSAVLISIVIFGEVVPQSICVRYGLPIGAFMAPVVLGLMWIMAPIAYPTAKLLDYLLGKDHGTMYKKAGLKTLVMLHRTLGSHPDERLNQDEVTIISAVLDLKEKPVGSIMTPMDDVFTLSADTVLDEEMMTTILSEGYSRIPIHAVDNPQNFIGMLLVKMLITYDPEDCARVRDFQLATLPETRPETSCLDIVNWFQEGKSHMVLVSKAPGESYGALGVVTLEDVIEELIGEEIVDESDVFIDVHKAIRRLQPAPRFRLPKGISYSPSTINAAAASNGDAPARDSSDLRNSRSDSVGGARKPSSVSPCARDATPRSPKTLLMRRRSSGNGERISMRSDTPELRQHLKHLGPSNAASRPKTTNISSVKVKPAAAGLRETMAAVPETGSFHTDNGVGYQDHDLRWSLPRARTWDRADVANEENTALLAPRLSEGGYGTLGSSPLSAIRIAPAQPKERTKSVDTAMQTELGGEEVAQLVAISEDGDAEGAVDRRDHEAGHESEGRSERSCAPLVVPGKMVLRLDHPSSLVDGDEDDERASLGLTTESPKSGKTGRSVESVVVEGSVPLSLEGIGRALSSVKLNARSGSITEQVVDVGGVRKVVLETTSSSDDERKRGGEEHGDEHESHEGEGKKKKKRKKRAGKKKKHAHESETIEEGVQS
ncbi:DUF21-domain-containing protein [Trichodelitschia bisporula]|uniref:DUF21-domain-containing protein n=1 Tax=Trichodelitschia bisporula TaxID=703511 RepID=A0A6G1HM48_9PEZI|nr:DUF21-domain-containing protein [Trichodelitschia bisporula]